jgi:hypothetical protein
MENVMGSYQAVFVGLDDERDFGICFLRADTLEEAKVEARTRSPKGQEVNSIKICHRGVKVDRIGVDL